MKGLPQMQLTGEQRAVLSSLAKFISSQTNVFILRGYAGTGKTTLLKAFLAHLETKQEKRPVMLMAPTGRAAKILRDKTGKGSTIHKGIYTKKEQIINYKRDDNFELSIDTESPSNKIIFEINQHFHGRRPIVIIDESSMISSKTSVDERFQFGTDNLLDDIISFADLQSGGQIIFIGDGAQLPPVGDSHSAALDRNFFETRKMTVCEASLKTVMRQGLGSLILENAMLIRDSIFKQRKDRFGISLKKDTEEFTDTSPSQAIIETARDWEHTVLITFSNSDAAKYNAAIRKRRFPEHPEPTTGDRLLVVRNAYDIPTHDINDGINLFNGEFCQILSVESEECRTAFVGNEKVELKFRDVTIRHESGTLIRTKIITNLLDNSTPILSEVESKALFSDFTNRHRNILKKSDRERFLTELHHDPYFNAIQVKYGYAITCHKAQGGEWPNVIVDFTGRTGLGDEALRWAYTAITRATTRLRIANYTAASPLFKLEFAAIAKASSFNGENHAREEGDTPSHTPFHDEHSAACKRAKFAAVLRILNRSEKLIRIKSQDYLESYFIEIEGTEFRFDTCHDKKGNFKPFEIKSQNANAAATDLLIRLNTPSKPEGRFHYTPSSAALEYLEEFIRSCAERCDHMITNIVEHPEQYFVNYYFFTTTYHKIQFYFNNKGEITQAYPSTFGPSDNNDLIKLIDEIMANK